MSISWGVGRGGGAWHGLGRWRLTGRTHGMPVGTLDGVSWPCACCGTALMSSPSWPWHRCSRGQEGDSLRLSTVTAEGRLSV